MDPAGSNDNSLIKAAPVWSIVVIAILGFLIIIFALFFLRRFRKRYHIHVNSQMEKSASIKSVETLVTGQQPKGSAIKTKDIEAIQDSAPVQDAPEPLQEIKISLPMPPPTTSFFAAKTELDNDTSEFYNIYSSSSKEAGKNRKSTEFPSNNGFISIDLDSFSNAAANIQKKACTMKKSLRQSIRKPTKDSKTIFTEESFSKGHSKEEIEDCEPMKPVLPQLLQSTEPLPELKMSLSSTTHSTPQDDIILDSEESFLAAQRIIRSASRKSRARSMIIDHDQLPSVPSKHEQLKFSTVRSSRVYTSNEHMTISSGSVKRLFRQSVLVPEEYSFTNDQGPLPATGSKEKGQLNTIDISKWSEKSVFPEKGVLTPTVESSSAGYSEAPQYRASLNNSIFSIYDTLSKRSAAVFTKEENTNKSISRHNSTKKETLGKSALKSFTASATQGMNKSLRGLFDHSSSLTSINKVLPSDSQKMELDVGKGIQETVNISRQSSRRTYVSQRSLTNNSIHSSTSERQRKLSPESSQKVEADSAIVRQSMSFMENEEIEKEVDALRQALQTTWESYEKSEPSVSEDLDGAGSMQPLGTNKLSSPRQSLLTKSLISQQAKKTTEFARSSALSDEVLPAPEPVASFSSSTIRTVVPENESPQKWMDPRYSKANTMGSNKILAANSHEELPSVSDDLKSRRSSEKCSEILLKQLKLPYKSGKSKGLNCELLTLLSQKSLTP
ncbi:hypothetical protein BY458DRAFT_532824 [Sporodiniella umbellata]|nr:hypothetical protein BY458DRAFT_532824 [Sporodiniella umbellata]